MQEGNGQIAALAFMWSTKPADADTHAFVQAAPLLLACPDNDEGGSGRLAELSAAYPQAILTPAVGARPGRHAPGRADMAH